MTNLINAEIGAVLGLIVAYLAIKTAENNSRLVQPIAQLFGLICFGLVSISLIVGK